MEGDVVSVASILSVIGDVFKSAVNWVGIVSDTVASNPLLLIGIVVGFIGLGVGLFKRLLHV